MKDNSKNKVAPREPSQSDTSSGGMKWMLVALILVALAAVAVVALKGNRPAPDQPPAQTAAPTNEPADSGPDLSKLQALKGRWQRPDGGYVLEIREIAPDGKVDAGYFNPQPIKVGRAQAKHEASATKVFIELNDTGYPGCTYNLTYDPQSGSLFGVYYQAAMQQSFDVVFVRLKEEGR